MSWCTQSNTTTGDGNRGGDLGQRSVLVGVRSNGGRHAQRIDSWRRQVCEQLYSTSPELHHEVLCGRMSLRAAAAELESRRAWLDRRGHEA